MEFLDIKFPRFSYEREMVECEDVVNVGEGEYGLNAWISYHNIVLLERISVTKMIEDEENIILEPGFEGEMISIQVSPTPRTTYDENGNPRIIVQLRYDIHIFAGDDMYFVILDSY